MRRGTFPRAVIPPAMLRWVVGLFLLVNGLLPALWILSTSFKTTIELRTIPITFLPAHPTFQNYIDAFTQQPLLLFVFNSFVVACLSGALTLFVASLGAYALVRLPVPGRGLILTFIIAVSTFPLVTLLVPLFEILRSLDLLNSYPALIFPYAVLSLPVCILVLMTFFDTIPYELEQAAMVDGCTRMGALWRVVMPLAAPGVFTAGILAFVNSWDEFLLALSFNASPAMRTLPVGITLYQGQFTFPWPEISAALVVGIIPVAVLIVAFQERVVSGLSAGGLKG